MLGILAILYLEYWQYYTRNTGNIIPGILAILYLKYWQNYTWNTGNTIPGILAILYLEYWQYYTWNTGNTTYTWKDVTSIVRKVASILTILYLKGCNQLCKDECHNTGYTIPGRM